MIVGMPFGRHPGATLSVSGLNATRVSAEAQSAHHAASSHDKEDTSPRSYLFPLKQDSGCLQLRPASFRPTIACGEATQPRPGGFSPVRGRSPHFAGGARARVGG